MAKIFKILATSLALSAITFLGTELATARGGGGGHFSGGHGGGGGAHFSGAGARFSGGQGRGGAHFGGGGARFSGAQFRGVSGGAARISGAHFRSFNGARVSGARGLAHLNRTHVRGLNSAHLGSSRFARMNGAHIRGLSAAHGSHVAWNHWGNHAWRTGWNGGWGGWNGGWGFWRGPVFWPFFYGDLFAFAFWPWGYYDPFWAYGDVFIWDAMFWPGPIYTYGPGSFDVYAYGGPARARSVRSRNNDRDVTGSTNSSDLAQNCGGLAPGVTDLPIDSIERAVRPTDEQRAALAALKAASSQASDALKSSCSNEALLTPLGRLDTVQKRLDGMTQALTIVRAPLDNFYNSLSEEQRQRFAALGSNVRTSRYRTTGNDLAELCSSRAEGFAQPPVDRIEQAVKPTPEQRDAFAKLRIASTEASNQLRASCPGETPRSPMDRFDALAKRLDAMAAAVKTVRPALADFYGSLTDEQKARFNMLGPPHQAASSRQGRVR